MKNFRNILATFAFVAFAGTAFGTDFGSEKTVIVKVTAPSAVQGTTTHFMIKGVDCNGKTWKIHTENRNYTREVGEGLVCTGNFNMFSQDSLSGAECTGGWGI